MMHYKLFICIAPITVMYVHTYIHTHTHTLVHARTDTHAQMHTQMYRVTPKTHMQNQNLPTYPGVPQAVTITGISSGSLLSFDKPKSLIIILEFSLLHVQNNKPSNHKA